MVNGTWFLVREVMRTWQDMSNIILGKRVYRSCYWCFCYLGTRCTATGFGRTSEGGWLSSKLQQVQLPIKPLDYCKQQYPRHTVIHWLIDKLTDLFIHWLLHSSLDLPIRHSSIYPSIPRSIHHPSIYPPIHPPLHLSIIPFIYFWIDWFLFIYSFIYFAHHIDRFIFTW